MSELSPANKCPTCGAALPANAPEDLCPKCLLLGVAAPTDPGSGPPPPRPPPPSLDDVAAAFPHLVFLLHEKSQPPLTFAFRTRDGDQGVMQITEFTNGPRSVSLRYKLLQAGQTNSAFHPVNP